MNKPQVWDIKSQIWRQCTFVQAYTTKRIGIVVNGTLKVVHAGSLRNFYTHPCRDCASCRYPCDQRKVD